MKGNTGWVISKESIVMLHNGLTAVATLSSMNLASIPYNVQ